MTTPATLTPLSNLKVEFKPITWDGNAATLFAWFRQMETFYALNGITDEPTKAALVTAYVTLEVTQYLIGFTLNDWTTVKTQLKHRYWNAGIQTRAVQRMMTIKQTSSLSAYHDFFTSVYNTIPAGSISPAMLFNYYVQGLSSDHIKRQLRNEGIDTTNMTCIDTAMGKAIELSSFKEFKADGNENKKGSSSVAQPSKSITKVAALAITRDQAIKESFNTFSPGGTIPLLGFDDSGSHHSFISPPTVAWLGKENEIEVKDAFDVVYQVGSDPIVLTERVKLSFSTDISGEKFDIEPQYYYIIRIPFVHIIFGSQTSSKARPVPMLESGGGDSLRTTPTEMWPPTIPREIRPLRPRTEAAIDAPRLEYALENLITTPKVILTPTEGTSTIEAASLPETPTADYITEINADTRLSELARKVVSLVKDMGAREGIAPEATYLWQRMKKLMIGEEISDIVTQEMRELGWSAADTRKPPPIFDPQSRLYCSVK